MGQFKHAVVLIGWESSLEIMVALVLNEIILKQIALCHGINPNIVLHYRRRGLDVSRDEFNCKSASPSFDMDVIESFLACRISNKLCVLGCDEVRISITKQSGVDASRVLSLFYSRYDGKLSLGKVSDLIFRVYGKSLQFQIEENHDSLVIVGSRTDLSSKSEEDRYVRDPYSSLFYRKGIYVALNVGHSLCSVGTVNLSDHGFELRGVKRFSTNSLRCKQTAQDLIQKALLGEINCHNPNEPCAGACLSIAETVIGGKAYPNLSGGLFGGIPGNFADQFVETTCQTLMNTCSTDNMVVINDACAQGIYSSRKMASYFSGRIENYGTNILTIRLGTWASISYINEYGYNIERMNEFSYLSMHTIVEATTNDFFSIGELLSFKGFEIIARDLGLQEKYGFELGVTQMELHRMLLSGGVMEYDAACVYIQLGKYIALLTDELQYDVPVKAICILGSIANKIDYKVFKLIKCGFESYKWKERILAEIKFCFLPNSSHESSIVGACLQASEEIYTSANRRLPNTF